MLFAAILQVLQAVVNAEKHGSTTMQSPKVGLACDSSLPNILPLTVPKMNSCKRRLSYGRIDGLLLWGHWYL